MDDGRLVFGEGAGKPLIVHRSGDSTITVGGCLSVKSQDLPVYEGPMSVVPSGSVQTLNTDGMAVSGDIVVQPIPSNWGRIVYDGSIITVV